MLEPCGRPQKRRVWGDSLLRTQRRCWRIVRHVSRGTFYWHKGWRLLCTEEGLAVEVVNSVLRVPGTLEFDEAKAYGSPLVGGGGPEG